MTYQDRICKYIDHWSELDALDSVSNPSEVERARFHDLCAETAVMISEDRDRTAKSKSQMMGDGSDDEHRAEEAVSEITAKVRSIRHQKIGHGVSEIGDLAIAFWGLTGRPAGHYASLRTDPASKVCALEDNKANRVPGSD